MFTPTTLSPSLSKIAGVPVYLKREDLHPYGSHKGRSLPHMIDHAIKKGITKFVISSSGNAALSAAIHIEKLANLGHDVSLRIFVGEKIPKEKLDNLTIRQSSRVTIEQTPRPLQSAITLSKQGYHQLRQSTDEIATTGYHALADELLCVPNLSNVFIGTSSGTTAIGLYDRFSELKKPIKIHIVQTVACHPMAKPFDDACEGDSIANAISDKTAFRKIAVEKIVRESKGGGWIVSDTDIIEAQNLLRNENIKATPNGALGVAGLMRASGKGLLFHGAITCIITGK
jgi:threonine dehydratase